AVGGRAGDVLEIAEVGRHHAHLERARLQALDDVADAAWQLDELVDLRGEEGKQRVRLEPVSELGRDNPERLFADQAYRIELRGESARNLVGLSKRLAHECEAGRQADGRPARDPL